MNGGRLSAHYAGQQGIPTCLISAHQHAHKRPETCQYGGALRLRCPKSTPKHGKSWCKSPWQPAVLSTPDDLEPCSMSPEPLPLQVGHQSLRQKGELRIAMLGLCSLSILQRKQPEPRYERTHRRWFGLRSGKLIALEGHSQQPDALHRILAGAQGVMPVEAWTAVGGFLLAMLLQWVAAAIKGRALRRIQRKEARQQALLQAQKASYRHRSRFQRALGSPSAAAPAAEHGGEDYDGLPESSFSQPAHREEDFEMEDTVEEGEEGEEEPWEYDSEALKHWEQFVKKSKATQVSEGSWWDMDAAALDDRTIAASQERRDRNT